MGEGREKYIVNRVNGLHDFWRDLSGAPPSDANRAMFAKLFTKQVKN